MKNTDYTEVTFDWNGKEYTAYGMAEINVLNEDIGPSGYSDHCNVDVADNAMMSLIEVEHNGEILLDPPKELIDKAEDFLACKAVEDYEAGK